LQLAPHIDAAEHALGAARVRAAREASARLTLDERAARAFELIGLPVQTRAF
jgi:hypothetical protein